MCALITIGTPGREFRWVLDPVTRPDPNNCHIWVFLSSKWSALAVYSDKKGPTPHNKEDVQFLPREIDVGVRQSMHFAFLSLSFSTEKYLL